MIGLTIPEDQEASFQEDYATWCLSEDVMNMLVKGDAARDYSVRDPYATTNTSNPIKSSVMVATFQDMNSTFAQFLRAYPSVSVEGR